MLGMGLIVVTDQAAAAGGVALPSPLDDANAGWMWHSFQPFLASGVTLDAGSEDYRVVEIDTKAMRKLGVNQQLAFIAEVSTGNYSAIVITAGLRALFGEF